VNVEASFAVGLGLLVIAVAIFAVVARESFAAVVAFVVYGLLLSLGWMVINCPDVALTEAAVGGGVTGALLLGACSRLRSEEGVSDGLRPGMIGRGAAILLCVAVSAGLSYVVISLPDPAPTLAPEATKHLPSTGLGNPVTAVLMTYRALDTMLEKVVLLLALVAVWSLAPDRFWGGRPAYGYPAEAGGPLVFLTRVLAPIGVIAGIYLFWVGADAPGGAFAGGAILSAMWLLGFLSGLMAVPAVSGFRLRFILVVGVIVFLAAGLAGMAVATGFLAYPVGFEKPIIVAIEIAMTLSIGATLGLLVAGAPGQPAES
jgi:multisubunit Na+/H+ antiporter MnhB subunit